MTVRSHRKIRRRRTSGVAPIVASMLLISITVFAFTVVWGVTISYLSNQRFGPLQQMRERIIVEDVYFFENSTGKYLGVYARNSGKVALVVQDIGVNGSSLANSSPKNLPLGVGQAGWINASLAWSPDSAYLITATSQRGSRVTSNASP